MREISLIKEAIRVGSPDGAAISVSGPLDWGRVVTLARHHGVLALVARALKAAGWRGVPPDVVEELVAYRAGLAARNLFLTRELLAILRLLCDHGITALPYKGPLLAAYAYGDLGLRPFSDLDLILAEPDVVRARSLLLSHGYRSLSPRTDSERPDALPPGYALALQGADDSVVVELHWRIAPSFPLRFADLLPGTRPFRLLDTEVPCLAPEQLLLTLCVHGAKHAWERLEWVCAVAHLIAREPDLDWDAVKRDANALGARRPVALGLALAAGVAAAPVPKEVLRAVGGDAVRPLAFEIEAGLLERLPRSEDPVTRFSLHFRARTIEERVRYVLFLRHPTEKDRQFLKLPTRLAFLYVLVRPLRVAYERTALGHRSRWSERTARRQAVRARHRQLEYQEKKAAALHGREEEVVSALALRWDRVRRRLQRINPKWDDGGRILEVGSGAHGLVFGTGNRRAVGIDPHAADYARLFPAWQRTVPTVAAGGEQLPFRTGAFDMVLCDNVVDHAGHPLAIVAEMARVLAPGGVLYFTVNVHHRLYGLAARAHQAWNAAGIPLEIGPFADHTFHFTANEARNLFSNVPLDIRREHTYLEEAKVRAWRRRIRHPGHLLPLVFFKNAPFEVIAERR